MNVKEIIFVSDLNEYMNFSIKPNFKVVGKVLGPKMKEFQTLLENLSDEEINKLNSNQSIKIVLSNEEMEVTPDMIEIRISSKEGFDVASLNNNFIILNTTLTDELILEGIARELVRKIQSLRKDADLVITDRIKVYYDGDTLIDDTIKTYSEFIKNETLAVELIKKSNVSEKFDMNDTTAELKIEKI